LKQHNLPHESETSVKLPIPLTVLTGFLGSGKTTLLKVALGAPSMAGTAVIVNEFGEVGLDDALIRAVGQSIDDTTVLLPSGCVCCEVKGDLVAALLKLHEDVLASRIPDISRVVLETTGLADPGPIARVLLTDRDLFRVYRLDGVVTTVDAEFIRSQLGEHGEPARQIALADRLVLTKTDRVTPAQAADAEWLLGELNPAATMTTAIKGNIDPSLLFDIAATEIVASGRDAKAWLAADRYDGAITHQHDCAALGCDQGHHHHGDAAATHLHGIRSFAIVFEKPLDGQKLEGIMEAVRIVYGAKILRMKGILAITGEELPIVIHGVCQAFYPTEQLPAWPSADRRSRIVFITKDLEERAIRTAFAPLLA
jgi:G3E family GTPase